MSQGFSFVGLVNLHARTGSGGKGLGRFVGNCPKLSMPFNPKAIERNESMTTARSPFRRMTQATSADLTMVTDEFSKANFALAVGGRVDNVVADTVTTITETLPIGAVVGSVLSVSKRNINTLVVTDSTGSPKTLALGVDYTVDLFSGDITILDLTTNGPFVQPFHAAFKQGAVAIVAGLAVQSQELWLSLNGTNADDGQKGVLDVYRVRFDTAKIIEWINNDYQDFELTGSALLDTTKAASAIGGQVFQFALPATHD